MNIQHKEILNEQEYINFVREFVTLVDKQLNIWENLAKNKETLPNLADQMPAIISLVNTVGYLRGQDGVFLDIRPRTENRKELYAYEDIFESRLCKLIDTLMSSDERENYQKRLKSYFIEARTK